MSTYAESGVNIENGDACSRLAYAAAKATFAGRAGRIGAPAILEDGFSGALDMGDFFLVQNDDGVGSKMMVAEALGRFETVGHDLLAMVADDAICVGAEVLTISNTVDIEKVDAQVIGPMMEGLKKACLEQNIVIPGGEIAELPGQVRGVIWNATSVGIVEKDKFIDGSKVVAGDKVIGIRSVGFRSNGFSLVRYVLKNQFGENWAHADYGDGRSWGEVVLTPSLIYHAQMLKLLGRYGQPRQVDVHGIVHVTGGGLDGNAARVVRNGLKVKWTDLWPAHEPMLKLMEMGKISEEEARKTWNMGTGMIVVLPESEVEKALSILNEVFEAKVVGEITG